MESPKKLSPVIVALIVIVLVGVAVTAVVIAQKPKDSTVSETSQNDKHLLNLRLSMLTLLLIIKMARTRKRAATLAQVVPNRLM